MSRPVIGITTYVEPASWAVWHDVPAALIPHAYVRQVAAAGGLPLLVPPLPDGTTEDDVRELLGRLDGLILAGGADVEPARYGAEPHPSVQAPRPRPRRQRADAGPGQRATASCRCSASAAGCR